MANINEILARAAALRDETALNSISPERAGSIMNDTLMALNELWLQQGSALVISKIYASVAAMQADTDPVSDISGKPLRPGQIVVIASSDTDNGSVYRYNGSATPSWSLVGVIGNLEPVDSLDSDSTQLPLAAHQGKVLDGKISQLGQEVTDLENVQIPLSGDVLESAYFTQSSPTIVSYSAGFNVNSYRVKQGDKLKISANESQNRAFNYGFTTVLPADNVPVSNATSINTSSIDLDLTAPEDGYFVFAKYFGYFTDISVIWYEGTKDIVVKNMDAAEKAREAGEYEQNPIYIRAYTDKDGRFLWGIRNDGNIEYGVGVPPQVVSYINEKISELQLDDVADIVDFLSGLLDGDETLKEYLDSTYGKYDENPEWIKATTDADGRIIEGIHRDGTKVFTVPVSIEGVSHGTFNDPEGRLESTNDADGKILSYRDKNGVLVEKVGIKTKEIDLEKAGMNKLRSDINKAYDTVKEAVEDGHIGVFQCGTNMVVGLKELTTPYTLKEIEDNYKNILPNPKFPFIKTVSLHRLYDDAATPNMLYMCSCSDKHIFYSICPTDTKRAFGTVDPDYYTKYTANYFYYADKETPSVLHKVVLPASYTKRIKFVFEMSNGDCLIEIENGSPVPGMSVASYNNIYVVKGVFSGTPVQESDITFSLTFDYWLSKISSFDNIVEYKAGHIVLAPYSGGRSGKVYISHDYGATWDLIFCTNSENTHFIKPKAEHYGDANAYGLYPLPEQMNPGGELDWDATVNVNVHIHGIAYDRWYDRIWIVTGDGGAQQPHNVTGIWWTDDEGYTWKRIGGGKEIGTQLIGIVPMEHCVIFPTDGTGNGFWRWSRNGKDTIIKIEPCYNYTDVNGLAVYGGRSTIAENGFRLTTFAPENYNVQGWSKLGGVVATFNGYDFEKIYEDSFGEGTYETAEIGCCCGIVDCGNKIILSAYYGGYIELTY